MEVPAGDERTQSLLLSKYKSKGCFYCSERLNQTRRDHTHLNCPNRPCYLCKKRGHLAEQCEYRPKPSTQQTNTLRTLSERNGKRSKKYHFLREREIEVISEHIHPSILHIRSRQLDSKASFVGRKLHGKRITSVEWLPGDETKIISGDKAGVLRLWNIGDSLRNGWLDVDTALKGKAVTTHAHYCNINQIVLDQNKPDLVYTSSSDGLVCAVAMSRMDEEDFTVLQNLNPNGWQGKISTFKMFYGLRYHQERQCLFAGVSDGAITRFDPREGKDLDVDAKFHKGKVTCIDINPRSQNLLVTSSNDRTVRFWDARKFVPGQELGSYTHGRVVSSAYFSPNTGSKLLTTSFDNKLQVWNDIHAFQGDVNDFADAAPIEIVHSHDFHRHLNGFRATWDPKDWRDDLFVCGRFMGDAYYNEGVSEEEATVLHPIDIFSATTGEIIHSLIDSAMPLISPIAKCAPHADVVLTAASRDLVLWSPPPLGVRSDSKMRKTSGRGERGDDDNGDDGGDDDDDDDNNKRKKRKIVTRKTTRASRAAKRRAVS